MRAPLVCTKPKRFISRLDHRVGGGVSSEGIQPPSFNNADKNVPDEVVCEQFGDIIISKAPTI